MEFNLGRLAQIEGRSADAETHFKLALADNPRMFLPALNLGTISAQRQDWPSALTYYRRAEAIVFIAIEQTMIHGQQHQRSVRPLSRVLRGHRAGL